MRKFNISSGSGSGSGNPQSGCGRVRETSVILLMAGVLGASLFGCGKTTESLQQSQFPGTPFTNTTTVTTVTTGTEGFLPAYTYSYMITGMGGTTPEYRTPASGIQTDSILKVKVTSGVAGAVTVPGYEAYTMNYGCIRYNVSLYTKQGANWIQNGQTYTTPMLSVQGGNTQNCSGAADSLIIDFSHRLSGPSPIQVKIDAAAYDFYCNYFWAIYYSGYDPYYYVGTYADNCPARRVYKNHQVGGSLAIQVNGTAL